MPKGVQRSEEELLQRKKEIAHIAAELFFKCGFNETSVNQIARSASIGKSTLYEFFSSKDEIILLLLDEPLSEVRSNARKIVILEESVVERIQQILVMHMEVLSRDKALIFKLFFESQRLPLEVQDRHEIKRKEYQAILLALVEEGIENGEFRQVNPALAVKMLLSALSTVMMTRNPTGTNSEMLTEALDIIFVGIKKDNKNE